MLVPVLSAAANLTFRVASYFTLSVLGFSLAFITGIVTGHFIFVNSLPNYDKDDDSPPLKLGSTSDCLSMKEIKDMRADFPDWLKQPDVERMDWLNRLFALLWPYINEAVIAEVNKTVPQMIAEKKPAFVERIDIAKLTLGNLAPTIQGMKTYETTDDEVILEPIIFFAGNPTIKVSAVIYGFTVTVQLKDLLIRLRPRITLKPLIPTMPCFGGVKITLVEKPSVDFGLRIFGADIMALPGLYTIVQQVVAAQVANSLIWPAAMEVYSTEPAQQTPPAGTLHITQLRIERLKNVEFLSKTDPFVKLYLLDVMEYKSARAGAQTSVLYNNLNPDWTGEEYVLDVDEPEDQVVMLEVRDQEMMTADRLVGAQRVPLRILEEGVCTPLTLQLLSSPEDLPPLNRETILAEHEDDDEGDEHDAGTGAAGGSPAGVGGDTEGIDENAPPTPTANKVQSPTDKNGTTADLGSSPPGVPGAPSSTSPDAGPGKKAVLKTKKTRRAAFAKAVSRVGIVGLLMGGQEEEEEGEGGRKASCGTISFCLEYRKSAMANHPTVSSAALKEGAAELPADLPAGWGRLSLRIHSAERLTTKNGSPPNLYFSVKFRSNEKKTKVMNKATDMEFFFEPMEFYSEHPPASEVLHITAWNYQVLLPKELIGTCDVPLDDVIANKRINEFYDMMQSSSGATVKVEMEWKQKGLAHSTSSHAMKTPDAA